jgi:ribosomal protein L40E
MPTFGAVENQQIPGGFGIVQSYPVGDPRNIENIRRQVELDRISVPDELEAITELSDATTVWIYSVGAWPQFVSLGSLGSHTIPGISEEHCLVDGDLTVSAPLPVKGIPSETYPVDDGGRRIYHRPQKNDPLRKHTGMHLALEIIGAGVKSKVDNDLRPWGCFVSEVPEQQPGSPLFAKWKKAVEDAKAALKLNYSKRLAKANEAFKNGNYQKLYEGDERLPIITRVMKVKKSDCPFMENMVAPESKQCINCREHLPPDALSCGKCGQRQVSDKKYEEEIAKRLAAASGEPEKKRRGRPAASAIPEVPDEDENPKPEDEDDIV